MKTLQLNFQKWFNEYNVCDHKIKARDAAKRKLENARDEVMKAQLQKEFDFQNKVTYQVMYELVDTRFNMLNPIITKWLQVQQIYYSKSFAHFGPIASIDPMMTITNKKINKPEDESRPVGSFVNEEPKKDKLSYKMEAIAGDDVNSSKFVTNELNQMVADVPRLSEK